ncbi:MAG: protein kinase [Bryobacterales bacterium]|nr:protein kinase [Bryobacterales bacterium]MBV9400765.1 protein kinase [Bryobacterales bacterium]
MTGTEIAHYRIVGKVGEGGMGAVYKALDTRLGRHVALKTISVAKPLTEQRRLRLIREAKTACSLNHPNIVTIYDVLTHDGQFYIAMEFVEGITLKDLLRKGIPLPKTVRYATQIAGALAKTHASGIIHRDLKPSNIMITPDDQVKLLDFGLAKLTESRRESYSDETATLGLTQDGMILGTVGYMSPEQAQASHVDARSDVFSFGLLLYEMLTGQRAFQKATQVSSLVALMHEEPVPLHDLTIECPLELEAIVERCLQKIPDRRYQTMLEVRHALDPIDSGSSSAVRVAPAPRPERGSSIAVLPFTNLSPDPGHQYFSDGLAEEIITALSNVRNLRVTARTSAFRFRKELDLQEIGEQLKVDYILTGSVRRAGSRLRVTVQLVDPRQDCHLWTERYDRTMDDVFAIQDEISNAVVEALKQQITSGSSAGQSWELPQKDRQPKDIRAHEDYLRGRYCLAKRSWASIRQAIAFFESALQKDSEHALSKVGLADCYNLLGYYNERPPREAFPKAIAAAEEAIAINARLGEAYASLGYSLTFHDWNWVAADRAFSQATHLSPGYASAKHWKTWLHFARGEFQAALNCIRAAQQVDPLAPILNAHVGLALAYAGQPAEAVEQLQKTLGLDPDFALGHYHLGTVFTLAGEFEKAIEAFESADRKSGGSLGLGLLGCDYALVGRQAEAEHILNRMEQGKGYISPLQMAYVEAGLGRADAAFELLDRAYEDRSADLVRLRLQPWPKAILEDSRLNALAERIGLPPVEIQRVFG